MSKYLLIGDVQERFPFSVVHITRMIRGGNFPAPVQLGGSRRAWLECELDAWEQARILKREADTITRAEKAAAVRAAIPVNAPAKRTATRQARKAMGVSK